MDPGCFDHSGAPAASLAITAIVVASNEARFLERCLEAIRFCDQVLIVDQEFGR